MPSTSKVTSVPEPAGIVEPVKLKPITILPPVDTVKPLAAASPPEAETRLPLSTLNWKPPIGK